MRYSINSEIIHFDNPLCGKDWPKICIDLSLVFISRIAVYLFRDRELDVRNMRWKPWVSKFPSFKIFMRVCYMFWFGRIRFELETYPRVKEHHVYTYIADKHRNNLPFLSKTWRVCPALSGGAMEAVLILFLWASLSSPSPLSQWSWRDFISEGFLSSLFYVFVFVNSDLI